MPAISIYVVNIRTYHQLYIYTVYIYIYLCMGNISNTSLTNRDAQRSEVTSLLSQRPIYREL